MRGIYTVDFVAPDFLPRRPLKTARSPRSFSRLRPTRASRSLHRPGVSRGTKDNSDGA